MKSFGKTFRVTNNENKKERAYLCLFLGYVAVSGLGKADI